MRRPRPGDVLEVTVDGHPRYLHYLGKHASYGPAIRVLDVREPAGTPEEVASLVASGGYVAFYPVGPAVAQGLVTIVGRHDEGARVPTDLRRAGAMTRDGRVLTWVIESDEGERVTKQLSSTEASLPIVDIWNHEMLCIRLRQGWRPEHEVGGQDAEHEVGGQDVEHDRDDAERIEGGSLVHYLYFATARMAAAAAEEVEDLGFTVESRASADGVNRLVLARRATRRRVDGEADMEADGELLAELATRHGGEYDGWEAEVPHPR